MQVFDDRRESRAPALRYLIYSKNEHEFGIYKSQNFEHNSVFDTWNSDFVEKRQHTIEESVTFSRAYVILR